VTNPAQNETATGGERMHAPYDKELQESGQLTSPTWELELFLSGAFVFSSFQLPGIIESVFRRLEPHVTEMTSFVLFDGALYAKAIAFTLILTFMIHLVARAQWVALLGLYSVFPRGIRWDEMKVGPLARELYQSRIPDLGQAVARLDNFCSIVFSAGLLVVVMFVYSTGIAAFLGTSAYLVSHLADRGRHMAIYFALIAFVLIFLPVAAGGIDRQYAGRFKPGSRGWRILRRLLRIAFTINMMRVTGPMMWTLATNVGRKTSIALLVTAVSFLLFLSVSDRLVQSDRLSINGYDYYGTSLAHGVAYQVYENQREDDESYLRIPSIQSDIIRDPYVKLFIPYYPARHNAAVAHACPTLKPLQDRGIQIGSDPPLADSLVVPVLDCLAKIHAVTLDGAPISSLQFAFYEHPKTGIKGMLSYIPVDSLAHGRHVLSVMPAPPDDTTKVAWKKPYLIPFWR
jgi:hypothetical protein